MSTVKRPSSMEKARTLTFEKSELLTDETRELTSTPAKTAPGQMVEFFIQSSEIQKNLEEVQRTNKKLSSEMLSMSQKWDGASETRKIRFVSKNCGRVLAQEVCQAHDIARVLSF